MKESRRSQQPLGSEASAVKSEFEVCFEQSLFLDHRKKNAGVTIQVHFFQLVSCFCVCVSFSTY